MSILKESNVPNLILSLNALQKQVNYRGIIREISDSYWQDEINPRLYPIWDTDKDRLIQLNYYDTGGFHAKRRKFVRNHTTGDYEWKDYEMEAIEHESAKELFEKLKEAFYLVDSVEKENFQQELAEAHFQANNISWFGIRIARQFLLDDCDWVMLADSPVTDPEELERWKQYRQALRDIPQNDTFIRPLDVRFPISPSDWKTWYQPDHPEESYLGSPSQFIKLSGYLLAHYKEKVVQYLLIKQSVMSPMNYKSYATHMSQMAGTVAETTQENSENFVDNLLTSVYEEDNP